MSAPVPSPFPADPAEATRRGVRGPEFGALFATSLAERLGADAADTRHPVGVIPRGVAEALVSQLGLSGIETYWS